MLLPGLIGRFSRILVRIGRRELLFNFAGNPLRKARAIRRFSKSDPRVLHQSTSGFQEVLNVHMPLSPYPLGSELVRIQREYRSLAVSLWPSPAEAGAESVGDRLEPVALHQRSRKTMSESGLGSSFRIDHAMVGKTQALVGPSALRGRTCSRISTTLSGKGIHVISFHFRSGRMAPSGLFFLSSNSSHRARRTSPERAACQTP